MLQKYGKIVDDSARSGEEEKLVRAMLLKEADQAGHLVTRLHQCVVVIYEGTLSLIFLIKLPSGAGVEITNCGSGTSFSFGSGSFLCTTHLKKFYKKIMVVEEVFVN
jgi:hypothetical protein